MAIALTKFEAYGIEIDECLTKRFKQYAYYTITAANSDVDIDIGDYSGTFWTAVGASAVGVPALKATKDIQTRAQTLVHVGGTGTIAWAQATTQTANCYVLALDGTNTKLPNVLYHSGDAPTAYTIVIEWELQDGQDPVKVLAP